MKINAITNASFRGLFTNKSHENGGNWKMEYSPYSWESNNTSKMANQTELDILGYTLPDNEKMYQMDCTGRKSCKDIFDTEFYYEYPNGTMRKTITEVPAMNLEESLKVQTEKLKEFAQIKKGRMRNQLEWDIKNSQKYSSKCKDAFVECSKEYDLGYFDRTHTRKGLKSRMAEHFDTLDTITNILRKNALEYMELSKSKDMIVDKIAENNKKIEILKEARLKDILIDISRRDVYDPNRALWLAMHNAKAIVNKIVALPHKTISVRQILNAIGHNIKEAEIPQKAIEYVDVLIKQAL